MKNIAELETKMGNMFDLLMTDPKRIHQAKEIANIGGKLINIQKVSIDYAKMHGNKARLPFMEREDV